MSFFALKPLPEFASFLWRGEPTSGGGGPGRQRVIEGLVEETAAHTAEQPPTGSSTPSRFFLTPVATRRTWAHSPLGHEKSRQGGNVSITPAGPTCGGTQVNSLSTPWPAGMLEPGNSALSGLNYFYIPPYATWPTMTTRLQ
jgi:hypothetical protein